LRFVWKLVLGICDFNSFPFRAGFQILGPKAGVARAYLHDPNIAGLYAAFAKHWGLVSLPS
jgi:hypothetical protein